MRTPVPLIPAKAGTQNRAHPVFHILRRAWLGVWVPASAGMSGG